MSQFKSSQWIIDLIYIEGSSVTLGVAMPPYSKQPPPFLSAAKMCRLILMHVIVQKGNDIKVLKKTYFDVFYSKVLKKKSKHKYGK